MLWVWPCRHAKLAPKYKDMYHFTAELPEMARRMCKRGMANDMAQHAVHGTQTVPVMNAGAADRDGLSPDRQMPDATIMVPLRSHRKK